MDDIDRAQEREQLDRDFALRAQRAAMASAPLGNGCCLECGIVIDARRLAAQPRALRCIECQIEFETWGRGR